MKFIKKSVLFPLIICSIFISISFAQENGNDKLREYCEKVPIENAIGQIFIVGLPDVDYTTYRDRSIVDTLINDIAVGGVMLNTYNFYIDKNIYDKKGKEYYLSEITEMINYLQSKAIKSKLGIPLFTCVDFESNYSSINKGIKLPPSALTMGHTNNTTYVKDTGIMVGNELTTIGINMLFGPVLDTPENVNGEYDDTLVNRYFTNRPDMTTSIASYYINGLIESGIMVVAKHFPGYCDLGKNPHSGIPIFSGNSKTIQKNITIYKNLKNSLTGIMSANYYIEKLSTEIPLMLHNTFPDFLVYNDDLCNNGFNVTETDLSNKIIITDDLSNMQIVENYKKKNDYTYSDIAIQAFNAGHDMILFSHFGEDGSIKNFELEDFKKIIKDMTCHIKSNKKAEKQFRNSLYKILSCKNKYDGRLNQSYPDFKKAWTKGPYKNIQDHVDISFLNKKYKSNSDLVFKMIEDGSVLLNQNNQISINGSRVLIIGSKPHMIKDGISGLVKSVDCLDIATYYESKNELNEVITKTISDIKSKSTDIDLIIFIVESVDHGTIIETLYLEKLINEDNTIILNHTIPTVLSNEILKKIKIFNTMSRITESYEVDKVFLTKPKNWNDEFRINLGYNKSINDVLQIDFKINPCELKDNLPIFMTHNEEKFNEQLNDVKQKNSTLLFEKFQLTSRIENKITIIDSLQKQNNRKNTIIIVLLLFLLITYREKIFKLLESFCNIIRYKINLKTLKQLSDKMSLVGNYLSGLKTMGKVILYIVIVILIAFGYITIKYPEGTSIQKIIQP